MNTQRLNQKSSLMILLVMVLTLAFSLVNTRKASASSEVTYREYSDGTACAEWHDTRVWYKYCSKPTKNGSGNIYFYNGNLKTPYFWAGQYDPNHFYYYNGRGGWAAVVERASGRIICPTRTKTWVYSNATCTTFAAGYGFLPAPMPTSNDSSFTITGGSTNQSGYAEIDAILMDVNSRIIDTWTAPNCASSYNGCR